MKALTNVMVMVLNFMGLPLLESTHIACDGS